MVLLRQTGLVIGAGGMYSNFKGYIDEVGNKMTKKKRLQNKEIQLLFNIDNKKRKTIAEYSTNLTPSM